MENCPPIRNIGVFGVGINDMKGEVDKVFYNQWYQMHRRCYSEKYLSKYPTYRKVKVCDEWKTLSNFKNWMESQSYKGCVLDKDILSKTGIKFTPPILVVLYQRE